MTRKYRLLSLFAGIGGFELGLERSGGFETVAQCEIDPFCRRVLAKHWPNVKRYEDVRELTAARLAADGITVDAICGGFPCQDISVAGKGAGIAEGTRSGLWYEYARLIGELRPRVVIVENVTGLLVGPSERPGAWFGRILGDVAALGYNAEWHCIPAGNVGAPHERDRIWLIANPYEARSQKRPIFSRMEGMETGAAWRQDPSVCAGWPAEPDVLRVVNGVSKRVDRIAALGNAVVPQIPELIGRAIMAADRARAAT